MHCNERRPLSTFAETHLFFLLSSFTQFLELYSCLIKLFYLWRSTVSFAHGSFTPGWLAVNLRHGTSHRVTWLCDHRIGF
jgi:hypothetical protein